MRALKYLAGYSEQVKIRVGQLIAENELGRVLSEKYRTAHEVRTDRALYQYTLQLKNEFLRNSQPLSRVSYDGRISIIDNALGLHCFVSRVQGAKLKSKHEIRIASLFKEGPQEFLRMIVVHELAHLKEKEHGKAFYQLCQHMEPEYHQLEFDTRLYLTHLDAAGTHPWQWSGQSAVT